MMRPNVAQCPANVWQMSNVSHTKPNATTCYTGDTRDTQGEDSLSFASSCYQWVTTDRREHATTTGPSLACPPAKPLKILFQKIA